MLDYITKQYIVAHIPYGVAIPVIKGFFNIVHTHNTGVAFGFLASLPDGYRMVLLGGISLFVFLIILYLILFGKDRHPAYIFGLALMGGGALGNLYGRVFKGYVVDFLDFYIRQYHYPAFNLADAFITMGVFILVLYKLKLKR